MRVVGFYLDGEPRLGAVDLDEVVNLQAVDNRIPTNLADWLRERDGDLSQLNELAHGAPAAARIPLSEVEFAQPVLRPNKIICLGLNYRRHVSEGRYAQDVPKFPTIFFRYATSFVAHEDALLRPAVSENLDYEAELVAVVGRPSKHLKLDNALDSIIGYTCANEGSIRNFQHRMSQWD